MFCREELEKVPSLRLTFLLHVHLQQWYPGRIERKYTVKGEDRYEILYDDGDHDVDVPAKVSAPIQSFFMCTDST